MFNRIIKNKKTLTKVGLIVAILIVVGLLAHSVNAIGEPPEVTFGNFFKPETWVQYLSYIYLSITAFILSIAGYALNFAINFSLKISVLVDGLPGIKQAWVVIRDVISMFFIFILLYTSIKVIIGKAQMNQVGKLIIGIIVAGFFINFSFVIIKVIIDATNMLALGIYNAIVPAGSGGAGLSDILMNITKQSGDALKSGNWSVAKMLSVVFQQVAMTLFYGSMNLITAIMFIAGAIMFVLRTITLIGMIAASPFLAFNFISIPVLDNLFGAEGKKLWKQFIGAAMFAPIFMLLIYIGLKILVSSGTAGALDAQIRAISDVNNSTTASQGMGDVIKQLVMSLITYTLVMGFYLAALKKGKDAGIIGADKIMGMATRNLESNAVMKGSVRMLSRVSSEAGQAAGNKFTKLMDSNYSIGKGGITRVAREDKDRESQTRLRRWVTSKDATLNSLLTKGISRTVDTRVSGVLDSASKNTGPLAETIRPMADSLRKSYDQTSIAKGSKAESTLEKEISKDKTRAENIENLKNLTSDYSNIDKLANLSDAEKLAKRTEANNKILETVGKMSESDKSEIKLDDLHKNKALAAIIGKKYFDSKEKDEKTDGAKLSDAKKARAEGIAEGITVKDGRPNQAILDNFRSLDGEELRDLLLMKDGANSDKPYYKNAKIAKYLDTNTLKKLEKVVSGTPEAKDIGEQIIAFETGAEGTPVTVPGFEYIKKRENAGNWGIESRLIDTIS